MNREKILARILGITIITISTTVIILIYSNTRGIPPVLYGTNSTDSLHLVYQNQTTLINDSFTLSKLASALRLSQRFKANRTNLNKSLIEVTFYLKSGDEVRLLIIDNVIYGDLLVSGWIYYKNDDFITSIRKYIKK